MSTTPTTNNNNNNNSLRKKISVAGAITLLLGVASHFSSTPTKTWLRSDSNHPVNADALSGTGNGGSYKATIGVSVYFTQQGVNAVLDTAGHPETHQFSHMGVYYIPYDIQHSGGGTQTYLTGETSVMPSVFLPSRFHGATTCDPRDRWPDVEPAPYSPHFPNLDGKGFEITYSNGPSFTDFTRYNQVLSVGSPGHYIEGSGSSDVVWHGSSDISIRVQTDLSPKDFYLAADTVARRMNARGGYGPTRNCQDFSLDLLTELSAPASMIQDAQQYHLSIYDRKFLGTSCLVAAPILSLEMCGNLGYRRNPLHVPPPCSQVNNNYNKIVPQYGTVDKGVGPHSCWSDSTQCVNHATCGNCCNGHHFPGAGIEPFCGPGQSCWSKGTECFNGISCDACCNGSHGTLMFHQCK